MLGLIPFGHWELVLTQRQEINTISLGGAAMRKVGMLFIGLLFISVTLAGCAQIEPETMMPPEQTALPGGGETSFILTSTAFTDGATIPVKYTCDGQSISPALNWGNDPAGTASLALILEDPDAPVKNFTHWVIFNLPPDLSGLPEAVPGDGTLAGGVVQGKNGGGGIGYFGPCPPKGPAHHYVFNLYAVDKSLDLAAGATKDEVRQAMEGHILAQGQLVGLYQR
jgi:Raf kinase inhibitor-like YbhB/YbcL family protein